MATTKTFFVLATFWLACAAVALLVTSYSTNEWVISDMDPSNGTGFSGHLNYGMFTGSFEKWVAETSSSYIIYSKSILRNY